MRASFGAARFGSTVVALGAILAVTPASAQQPAKPPAQPAPAKATAPAAKPAPDKAAPAKAPAPTTSPAAEKAPAEKAPAPTAPEKAPAPAARPAAAAQPAPAAQPAGAKPPVAAAQPAPAKPPTPAAPPPAKDDKAAEKAKEEAKKAYGEGKKLFEEGKFAEALEAFKKADAATPAASAKHYIAESYDKLGKSAEAMAAYRAFLAAGPTGKWEEKVGPAKARIAEIEASLPATLTVTVSPSDAKGLAIIVDGAPYAGAGLKPGVHKLEVKADGFETHSESRELKGSENASVAVTLKPVPVAKPEPIPAPVVTPTPAVEPPPAAPVAQSRVPAFVTLGIAGAGAILGGVFGGLAIKGESDFDANPTEDNAQKAERNALISDMSFGVALTFGVTGAVLLLSHGEEEGGEKSALRRPVVAPFAGPTGGGLAATWRF